MTFKNKEIQHEFINTLKQTDPKEFMIFPEGGIAWGYSEYHKSDYIGFWIGFICFKYRIFIFKSR